MSELKILGGQLRSYKGWLTQSINNCLELIKIPSSASSASSMVSRLESSLGELDERRHKVESCLESMEALDFGKDDDEDKKDREKYYAAQRLYYTAQGCIMQHRGCIMQHRGLYYTAQGLYDDAKAYPISTKIPDGPFLLPLTRV
mgnify:CR=1 FL=1